MTSFPQESKIVTMAKKTNKTIRQRRCLRASLPSGGTWQAILVGSLALIIGNESAANTTVEALVLVRGTTFFRRCQGIFFRMFFKQRSASQT